MSAMTSQITSRTIVYSTIYSGTDQRKHQSSASMAFVRGIHRWHTLWGTKIISKSTQASPVIVWRGLFVNKYASITKEFVHRMLNSYMIINLPVRMLRTCALDINIAPACPFLVYFFIVSRKVVSFFPTAYGRYQEEYTIIKLYSYVSHYTLCNKARCSFLGNQSNYYNYLIKVIGLWW